MYPRGYHHAYTRIAKILKSGISRTCYNVQKGNSHCATAGGYVTGTTILENRVNEQIHTYHASPLLGRTYRKARTLDINTHVQEYSQ